MWYSQTGHIYNTIRRMRFACWITKATDTPWEYKILFFTATMVTRTRLSNCIACLIKLLMWTSRYSLRILGRILSHSSETIAAGYQTILLRSSLKTLGKKFYSFWLRSNNDLCVFTFDEWFYATGSLSHVSSLSDWIVIMFWNSCYRIRSLEFSTVVNNHSVGF
jgi:hypothetical protein